MKNSQKHSVCMTLTLTVEQSADCVRLSPLSLSLCYTFTTAIKIILPHPLELTYYNSR